MSADSSSPTAPADVQATIAELWIYPVKSCAGIRVPEAELTDTGLLYDRAWMVDEVMACDMGDVAAQWFSDFLGPDAPANLKRLRLARFDPEVRRPCDPAWTGGREASTQFADGFGLLVASTASLDGLNARLAAAGHAPVEMQRFRPNIVLAGVEAHDEDRVGPLRITTDGASALIETVKPCGRCPIPNIDPATALASPEVSDTLQAYRQDPRLKGAITFGMNAIVLEGDGQMLRVGQSVSADWKFD